MTCQKESKPFLLLVLILRDAFYILICISFVEVAGKGHCIILLKDELTDIKCKAYSTIDKENSFTLILKGKKIAFQPPIKYFKFV